MSPSEYLYGSVIEHLEKIMETITSSPEFMFFAFVCSIKERIKRLFYH